MSWMCDYCDVEYDLASAPNSCRDHESTGFGAHNEVWFDFCSQTCRALHRGEGEANDAEHATDETEAGADTAEEPLERATPWAVRARRFGSTQTAVSYVEGDVPAWAVRTTPTDVDAGSRREVAA